MKRLVKAAGLALGLSPSMALACGGLFCNSSQPVNQAAERILFSVDDGMVNMHVRLSYDGPPTAFGWMLPVPADVEDALSSEQLFSNLDQNFGPRFNVQQVFADNCFQGQNAARASGGGVPSSDGGIAEDAAPPSVQVLSREAIGPFDRALLLADDTAVLRAWLDENEFAIPEATDALLQPYIDEGAAFLVLKLLPGADSGDIQPLRLKFRGTAPTIPIRPTQVAATPDMGIIVHLLGDERAIPKNYQHVQINDGALDWMGGGQNYADVVSQAADEAGGNAFATDYAGSSDVMLGTFQTFDVRGVREATKLGQVRDALGWLGDADIQRLVGGYFDPPEGMSLTQYIQCPECFGTGQFDWDQEVDGAALAARIEAEINPMREELGALFSKHHYLTRLYSTMSPTEMSLDPIFAFNPDLDEVPQGRNATLMVHCDFDGQPFPGGTLTTPSGFEIQVDGNLIMPNTIARQQGVTARGRDVPGAMIIEMMPESGQPMVIEDRTQALSDRYSTAKSSEGCDCDSTSSNPGPVALLGLGLLGLIRRRRG